MTYEESIERQRRMTDIGYDPVQPLPVKLSTKAHHKKGERGFDLSEVGQLVERLAPTLYAQGMTDPQMGKAMLSDMPVSQSRQYAYRWRVKHKKPANRKGSPRKKVVAQ